MGRFSYEDKGGTMRIKSWALPLVVAAVCVPVALSFMVTSQGPAIGFAVAALTATVVIVIAARSKPFRSMEVAGKRGEGRRVLVVAPEELAGEPLRRVTQLAAGADDVRVLVPVPSRALDRWLSAEDRARNAARDRLARSAGALTANGLKVSGSVGDSDPVQAVEDELRSFAADEVVFVSANGGDGKVEELRHKLALPLTRIDG